MSVPNTNTFSLSDVKTELESNGASTTTNLVDAFHHANSWGFDPTYLGEGDNLLNFRNYEHTPNVNWNLSDMTQIVTGENLC